MRVRVAAAIIKNNRLLLVKHCKANRSYWLLPGGGVEVGEVISESLKRELKEELNIDLKSFRFLFVVESISGIDKHIIQPTFLIEECDLANIKIGEDTRVCGFNFFSADQLKDLTIYPDINNELISLLNRGSEFASKRYILKQWKS